MRRSFRRWGAGRSGGVGWTEKRRDFIIGGGGGEARRRARGWEFGDDAGFGLSFTDQDDVAGIFRGVDYSTCR